MSRRGRRLTRVAVSCAKIGRMDDLRQRLAELLERVRDVQVRL